MPPLIWLMTPSGIDGTSAVVRAEDLLDVHASGLSVDGEFDVIDAAVGESLLRRTRARVWPVRRSRRSASWPPAARNVNDCESSSLKTTCPSLA